MTSAFDALHRTEPLPETAVDRTWPVLTHLSGLLGFAIPFANILAPLAIWLTKGKSDREVEAHAREALNFQITVTIAGLIAGVLTFVLIGIPMLVLIAVSQILLSIFAAVHASRGLLMHYPYTPTWVRAPAR